MPEDGCSAHPCSFRNLGHRGFFESDFQEQSHRRDQNAFLGCRLAGEFWSFGCVHGDAGASWSCQSARAARSRGVVDHRLAVDFEGGNRAIPERSPGSRDRRASLRETKNRPWAVRRGSRRQREPIGRHLRPSAVPPPPKSPRIHGRRRAGLLR